MFNLGDAKIKISCPECKYENKVNLEDFAKQNTLICGGCLREIHLVDNNSSTDQAIKRTKKNMQDIKNTIKRIKK
jgi:peptide subunit release factor 1 (eRF1)